MGQSVGSKGPAPGSAIADGTAKRARSRNIAEKLRRRTIGSLVFFATENPIQVGLALTDVLVLKVNSDDRQEFEMKSVKFCDKSWEAI